MINTDVITLLALLIFPLPYAIDPSPRLTRSPVTLALVVTNFAVFFATHVSPSRGLVEPTALFARYGLVPAAMHGVDLFTYMFLHVNGAHVLWNMIVLYLFGTVVEERVGSVRFAVLYVVGGVAAGLLDVFIVERFIADTSTAYVPVVGASGAIAGVVGLFAVFASGRSLRFFWGLGAVIGDRWHLLEIPAGIGVLVWLVQTLYGAAASLINPAAGGVAYFAHIGGFGFGVALGYAAGLGSLPAAPAGAVSRADSTRAMGQHETVMLLDRSVGEDDAERAWAMYQKCRSASATVPEPLLERLIALEERAGQRDRAVQVRAMLDRSPRREAH